MAQRYVVWFNEVDKEDLDLVGGKGANLGEMQKMRFPIPNGFIVTTHAYQQFLSENKLDEKIHHLINTTDITSSASLNNTQETIKKYIMQGELSETLIKDVFKAYKKLGGVLKDPWVAVRSSTTVEDMSSASFAGLQESFLNVYGEANVLLKIKEAWASLYDARALSYLQSKHMLHKHIRIAIVVQRMISSEKSGIMFSIDPLNKDKKKIVIEAAFGLGELIAQGEITPDHYEIDKDSMTITKKIVVKQDTMLKKSGLENKKVSVVKDLQNKQKITNEQILHLAKLAAQLEHHYYFPQDTEWAIEKEQIFIVQTRPITTTGIAKSTTTIQDAHDLVLQGLPAAQGIATGPVKIIRSTQDLASVKKGDMLVTTQATPYFLPAMKKAGGIIAEKGGRTSHTAIIAREIGIPAIVGVTRATKILKQDMIITIHGTNGNIYKGIYKTTDMPIDMSAAKTATRLHIQTEKMSSAKEIAKKQIDGIGLIHKDFLLRDIEIHPKKLINDGKKKEYIQKLADYIANFCRIFTPRPILYQLTDLTTDEYRTLIGGKTFEHPEEYAKLGFHGAYRFIHDPEILKLDLEAIKIARNKLGHKNIWIMTPFVRTVGEFIEVKKIISSAGLYRSASFKIWMNIDVPANVILLEDFIEAGIDGVTIDIDNLTMLLLGIDTDNEAMVTNYGNQDKALLWVYERVIKTANAHNIATSIYGRKSTLTPNLLEKLVTWGISSVTIAPEAIDHTRHLIAQFEKKLIS